MKIEISDSFMADIKAFEALFDKALNADAGGDFMDILNEASEKGRSVANMLSVVINTTVHVAAVEAVFVAGDFDIRHIESLEINDVDSTDYPDFVDAYWSGGHHKVLGRDLTDGELVKLQENFPEQLNEDAMESLR